MTFTIPSITVFPLSLTWHDTEMCATEPFSRFTSAAAVTSSPTCKGAGKRISWERNIHPGPGILVPRTAEISPLIRTPWTTVLPNLDFFANSSFKCKGFVSPVKSEKVTTSFCVKTLLSSALSPTFMCKFWNTGCPSSELINVGFLKALCWKIPPEIPCLKGHNISRNFSCTQPNQELHSVQD